MYLINYFSLHELQLARVEQRRHHRQAEKTLYLGDIHTDPAMRQIYRPTSYQDPLLHAEVKSHNDKCIPITRLFHHFIKLSIITILLTSPYFNFSVSRMCDLCVTSYR